MKKKEKTIEKTKIKNRGGRPSKEEEKKRTLIQKLYLNQEENLKLVNMLQSSNFQNMNDFIRAMLFENKIKIYFEDRNREKLIYQLSKIGGNVNQIATRMNQMKNNYNSVSEKEINVLHELTKLLKELKI